MIYILSDASRPLTFLTAGNLISEDRFLHPRRTIDSFEFISVTKGILHIQSDARSYHLSSGQFVLLPPGECHHGTVPSDGELSFYWTHFHFGAEYTIVHDDQQAAAAFQEKDFPRYILPETGTFSSNSRINILFVQLLDLAKRLGPISSMQCSYAQSTLLLELTSEYFFHYHLMQQNEHIPLSIITLMEWLQLNYDSALSVTDIARKFGYHPAYLTSVFRQYSGYTVTEYLNRQRIRAAKNYLTSEPKFTLAEISNQVGIMDEKYFMRLFKRYEGVTATSYREAFFQKKKNRI